MPNTSTLRLTVLCQATLLALAATAVQAQDAQKLDRVEVTGSSIKRIDGETPLPVEVLKRSDIDKIGVTTAAELLQKITSNVGGLTDGASITDQSGGQRGFNGANLRGLGVSSTLVLLNGRRLANFASPGDNAGVDLNNIPAGAIQRVEVLKDGASAIYGTDAMGGVINFITRTDYQGADFNAYLLSTQDGGAGKKAFNVSAGTGDLRKDGFNAFFAADVQQLDALNSSQRDWIKEYNLPGRLPPQLSSNTFPANVDLSSSQLAALNAFVLANPTTALKGSGPNGTWTPTSGRRVNFNKAACSGAPNPNSVAPTGPGGLEGCSYDYVAGAEIYPASDKFSVIGRAAFALNDNHQLFGELLLSKTSTDYAASPATQRFRTGSAIQLPASLQAVTGVTGNVDFRFRLEDAGKRTSRVDSEATRLVAGAQGSFGAWEYNTALNHSVNKATDTNLSGWVSFSKLEAGIRSGAYNPFVATNRAAGQAFMRGIAVDGGARMSEGSSTSLDAKLTGALAELGGGDLMLAVGAELRREKTEFSSTDAIKGNDIVGDRVTSGLSVQQALLADSAHDRDVAGVFAELSAPFSKELEAQFALRHDQYSGAYSARLNKTSPDLSTTNPKLGISWRPAKNFLARASVGTGFRAPSIAEMFLPLRSGITASFVKDPVSGEVAQMPIDRASNPDLKPEKSKQASIGFVFEPTRNVSGSVDFWTIRKTDIISEIGEETIFTNPVYYNDPSIVVRFSDGFVNFVNVKKENRGKLNTSGLDLALNWRGEATSLGRFGASVAGTLITEYKYNTDPRSPLVDGLGRFRDDKAVQRWRHKINLDWDMGPLALTLTNTYSSGYRDQNTPGLAAPEWNNRDVEAYSLWDLTGSYKFNANLRMRAGILNLLDTAPPFTNQSRYFQVTWDPTYGDPRGRSFFVSLNYAFK